ncbi:G-D-S-L family lipolytic protein [Lutibacter holmesii]|uniref:G-D-S-L family lipolytic protein n=1 Tax=Lutibacter holmesii TaxID=1137985 RepID=A0ABW3WL00_9FLAO
MKKIIYIAFFTIIFTACTDDDYGVTPYIVETPEADIPEIDYTSGTADFSNFVAVGNSLTAGYSDGALFIDGQNTSFPNILATQFQLAEESTFTQPLMSDNLGGLLLAGNQITSNRLYLSFASGSPNPEVINGTPTTEITNIITGPFNNMGVPGAKSYHLTAAGYGNIAGVATGQANPYYARMATSSESSVIADAISQNPSFFSLWIGNNDILSFATSGGAGIDQTGNMDPSSYGSNDITDPTIFSLVYSQLLENLTISGAKGVVSNIPSISSIPYFTTVPYNAIPLDAATATMLNSAFSEYNQGLQFIVDNTPYLSQEEADKRMVSFVEGQNAVLILDEDLTDLSALNPKLTNMRQATAEDLLVLTSRTFLGTTVGDNPLYINGVSVPLEDKWVLTATEQELVETARLAYNTSIENLATQHGLAFYNAAATLQELNEVGITQNGITSTATYATGGAFSLDGVHPSPRGYAIISNGMIDVINATYQSNIPNVNVGNYQGLYIN